MPSSISKKMLLFLAFVAAPAAALVSPGRRLQDLNGDDEQERRRLCTSISTAMNDEAKIYDMANIPTYTTCDIMTAMTTFGEKCADSCYGTALAGLLPAAKSTGALIGDNILLGSPCTVNAKPCPWNLDVIERVYDPKYDVLATIETARTNTILPTTFEKLGVCPEGQCCSNTAPPCDFDFGNQYCRLLDFDLSGTDPTKVIQLDGRRKLRGSAGENRELRGAGEDDAGRRHPLFGYHALTCPPVLVNVAMDDCETAQNSDLPQCAGLTELYMFEYCIDEGGVCGSPPVESSCYALSEGRRLHDGEDHGPVIYTGVEPRPGIMEMKDKVEKEEEKAVLFEGTCVELPDQTATLEKRACKIPECIFFSPTAPVSDTKTNRRQLEEDDLAKILDAILAIADADATA